MNVYEKLQSCRVELQETKLKKSGKNNYSGFEYFELKDFLPTINKLFEKYQLCSNFSMDCTIATLTIIDCVDLKEIVFTSPTEELELKGCNKIQALGGIHTYLKRYLYLNALEIVESDMFDAVAGSNKVQEKATSKPANKSLDEKGVFISLKQKNELKEKLGGVEFAKIMNANNGKITVEKFVELMQ